MRGEPTAQAGLRFAVWLGGGKLDGEETYAPDIQVEKGGMRVASGHAYMVMDRTVMAKSELCSRRPMPFALGARGDPKFKDGHRPPL